MDAILITGDFNLPDSILNSGIEIIHLRRVHSRSQLKCELEKIQGYILGGPEYLDADLLDFAKHLKHLVVLGTGTSSFVDIENAQSRGIRIDNIPGINAEAVSEFAFGMMIVHNANSFHSYASMRDGSEWFQSPWTSLKEQTIGLVGLGNIGQALLRRLHGFGCKNIFYHSPSVKHEMESVYGITKLSLKELLERSDLILVQVKYNESTHKLFNDETLAFCKSGSKLFCFSNPKVIVPNALKNALIKHGSLSFAYMDGFYEEWIDCPGLKDPKGLLNLPPNQFVATSHIAAQERHTLDKMLNLAWEKFLSHRKKCNE